MLSSQLDSAAMRGGVLQLKWLCVVAVVFFIVSLITMMLVTSRAFADDPKQEFLEAARQVQQQLEQLLQVYNSATPEQRAQMDAAVAQGMQQALQQVYWSAPADTRAEWDNQTRQATGYTIPQLFQSATTIPGLANAVNALLGALGAPVPVPVPTPSPTPTPVPTPSPTPPNPEITRQGPLSSAAADGVYIGSGQLKLGWVLFGRTDLSEEDAQALYEQKTQTRKDSLQAALNDADKQLAASKRRLEAFQSSAATKNTQGIRKTLEEDLVDAKRDRLNALKSLGLPLLGLGSAGGEQGAKEWLESGARYPTLARDLERLAKGAGTALDIYSVGEGGTKLAQFTEIAGQKTASGESLSRQDLNLGAEGMVSYVTGTAGLIGSKIGLPVAAAEALLGGIELGLAQRQVNILENAIGQQSTVLNENLNRFQNEVNIAAERKAYLEQQLNGLNQEGHYLDTWRP